jgi:hypothetical protein
MGRFSLAERGRKPGGLLKGEPLFSGQVDHCVASHRVL